MADNEGEKKFSEAGKLKEGSYVLIDDCVCQVKSVEKSKPGKHGAAKVRVTAMDIFSGQKKGLMQPTSSDVLIPMVIRANGQVVAVMGNVVQIMDMESYETFDVEKPADIQGLASGVEVEYMRYGKNVKIVRKK